MNQQGYYSHLEFLTFDVPTGGVGTPIGLEEKLKKIAAQLPNIFIGGDWNRDVVDAELGNIKTAKDGYIQAQREKDRLLDWRTKANGSTDLWSSKKDPNTYDIDDLLTHAKKDVYDFFYLGKGAIGVDKDKFWKDLDVALAKKTAADVKTALDAIKTDINSKVVDVSEINVIGWRKDVLDGLNSISPLLGLGTFSFVASKVEETVKGTKTGGTIVLTIDKAKGALTVAGFSLEKASGETLADLKGAKQPTAIQIAFGKDVTTGPLQARYDDLKKNLKKNLNIEISIIHADKIKWDGTAYYFTLDEDTFDKIKVERDAVLEAKVKKFQTDVEKLINDFSNSTWTAADLEVDHAASGVVHWGDNKDRGGIGATWQKYLDNITVDGTGTNYDGYDDVTSDVIRGVTETLTLELFKRYVKNQAVKSDLLKLMDDILKGEVAKKWGASGPNYFIGKETRIDTIIDGSSGKIEVGLKNKKVEEVIDGLSKDKLAAKDWLKVLNRIETFIKQKEFEDAWKEINQYNAKIKEFEDEIKDKSLTGTAKTDKEKEIKDVKAKRDLLAKTAMDKIAVETKMIESLYGTPIAELSIDLKGTKTKKELLAVASANGYPSVKTKLISSAKNKHEWINAWEPINTAGGGNCFLNAFGTLLTGNPSPWGEYSYPLRTELAMKYMLHPDSLAGGSDEERFRTIYDKFLINKGEDGVERPLVVHGKWMYTDDCSRYAEILGRPINMVYVNTIKLGKVEVGDVVVHQYFSEKAPTVSYKPFTIFNDGGTHFTALAEPEEHQRGDLYFQVSSFDFDDSAKTIVIGIHNKTINGFKDESTTFSDKNKEDLKKFDMGDIDEIAIDFSADTKNTASDKDKIAEGYYVEIKDLIEITTRNYDFTASTGEKLPQLASTVTIVAGDKGGAKRAVAKEIFKIEVIKAYDASDNTRNPTVINSSGKNVLVLYNTRLANIRPNNYQPT